MAWDSTKPSDGSKLVSSELRDNFTALNTPGYLHSGALGVSGSGFLSNAKRIDSLSAPLNFNGANVSFGATSGSVGIGTTNPSEKFEVAGKAIFDLQGQSYSAEVNLVSATSRTGGSNAITVTGTSTRARGLFSDFLLAAGSSNSSFLQAGVGKADSASLGGTTVAVGITGHAINADKNIGIAGNVNNGANRIGVFGSATITNDFSTFDIPTGIFAGYFSGNVTVAGDFSVRQLTSDAVSGSNIDVSELQMVMDLATTTVGAGVGIGFRVDTSSANIGAAIAHERRAGQSFGKLHFASKTTTSFGADLPINMTISDNGNVGIGSTAPTASTALDINSTTGALLVPRMTTTQRNALTALNGMIIYNTTTNAFNFYENGSWVTGSGLV